MKRHVLCYFGIHKWRYEGQQLGCCGLGLERFEVWVCERCPRMFSQIANTHEGKMPLYEDRLCTK